MAAITGAETKIGLVKASTWGTAVAVGAGDLIQLNSLSPAGDNETFSTNNIGSGLGMETDVVSGNEVYSASLDMQVGYENGADLILAAFLGDPQSPTEQNVGEGDYLHQILASTGIHSNDYLTLVAHATSTETIEFPTCSVESITLSHSNPQSPLNLVANLIASDFEEASTTNTFAVVDAATLRDPNNNKTNVRKSSEWRINAQSGGALSSSDNICVIGATIEMTRPQEIINEVCGDASSPVPSASDFLTGTVTLEFKDLEDLSYFTSFKDGDTFKAELLIDSGIQIGAGGNYSMNFKFPRLKIVSFPDYSVEDAGNNGYSLTFQILAATANPTGMDSTRPYVEITNTQTSSY